MAQTAKIFGVIAALGAVGYGVSQTVWFPQAFSVGPGDQAVLTTSDGTVSVLDPGVHVYNAARDEVALYATFWERTHLVPDALSVGDCPATVSVVYNVGDVLAFHNGGGDFAAIGAVDAEFRAVFPEGVADFGAPVTDALGVARAHLREVMDSGLQVIHLSADFGDCAPPPPRIVTIRDALPPIASAAPLGAERADMDVVNLVTADDARLEISGAVATYDVLDPAATESCFGTNFEDMAPDVVIVSVFAALRRSVGTRPQAEVAQAVQEAMAPLDSRVAQLRDGCGIAVGPVDVSAATVTRLIAVNCDDTPDAEACRP